MNRPTTACAECRELIGGYVLDALEPDEMSLVRRHLESCPDCTREHAELASIPALLEFADSADAVPARPPARLEDAVLDRFAREHRDDRDGADDHDVRERPPLRERLRSQRRRRPAWGIATAALATIAGAVAVAAGVMAISDDGGDNGSQVAENPPPAQTAPGVASRHYTAELAAVSAPPSADGTATLYKKQTGTVVHLKVTGLKPSSSTDGPWGYELWCVGDNGWRVSAGTFQVDANGNADIQLSAAADPRKYDTLSVESVKPLPGQNANRKRALVGKIHS